MDRPVILNFTSSSLVSGMEIQPGDLLSEINYPSDLRKLSKDKLFQLSTELRQYIIDTVSVYGGHFGASLGVVELTVALHYVFNTPYDPVSYTHLRAHETPEHLV